MQRRVTVILSSVVGMTFLKKMTSEKREKEPCGIWERGKGNILCKGPYVGESLDCLETKGRQLEQGEQGKRRSDKIGKTTDREVGMEVHHSNFCYSAS